MQFRIQSTCRQCWHTLGMWDHDTADPDLGAEIEAEVREAQERHRTECPYYGNEGK